jgi:hypothetical protein
MKRLNALSPYGLMNVACEAVVPVRGRECVWVYRYVSPVSVHDVS